jgi:L-seryl-tRNA(Ser) seleniumtransferase
MDKDALRALPSVDALLQAGVELVESYGHDSTLQAIRNTLDVARRKIQAGDSVLINADVLLTETHNRLSELFQPTLRSVINATGVIIHTNLGRAPLSTQAIQAMNAVAAGYSTLEFDLNTGKRGSRLLHAEQLLIDLTGAEAAMVVNNNASATVLLLAALAKDREVIISRGQLVEIGGGFRVPEILTQSGAALVEVGATNRTRPLDYEKAVTDKTALLMRVHSSNFKQIGFTESASLESLSEIAHAHNLYLVDDLGSGALIDTTQFGLEHEPTVQESISAGCDVVAFSGDKLLGGPQAGILVGKRELIDSLKRHPLARAIRADKLCLAALSATLDHYRRGEALIHIPILRMLSLSLDDLRQTAQDWASQLGDQAAIIDGESTIGGGSLPGATIPTTLLALNISHPDSFLADLRRLETPIIARIMNDSVVFDPRTVLSQQNHVMITGIASLLSGR